MIARTTRIRINGRRTVRFLLEERLLFLNHNKIFLLYFYRDISCPYYIEFAELF